MHIRLFILLLPLALLAFPAMVPAAAEPVGQVTTPSRNEGTPPPPVAAPAAADSFWSRLGVTERKGLALQVTSSYDPNFQVSTVTTNFSLHYDHGRLWDGVRAGNKEFKLEGVLGGLVRPELRTVVAVSMLSVYYPDLGKRAGFRPYLEAGIGGIYTDYQVEGQGLRLNFNPQVGVGGEFPANGDGGTYFSVRLHHVSNGSLNHNNQGINSLLFQIGRFF